MTATVAEVDDGDHDHVDDDDDWQPLSLKARAVAQDGFHRRPSLPLATMDWQGGWWWQHSGSWGWQRSGSGGYASSTRYGGGASSTGGGASLTGGGVSPPVGGVHLPAHPLSDSRGKNPEEIHAGADLIRVPFPFSIKKDFPDEMWGALKTEANERHLKITIRALRSSAFKRGTSAATGMTNQLTISKLHPEEPIPLSEGNGFYEDMFSVLAEVGLKMDGEPEVVEERDDSLGVRHVYMHGRLLEVSNAVPSTPQVTGFTAHVNLHDRSAAMIMRCPPYVFCRQQPVRLREALRSRSRRRHRSRPPSPNRRRSPSPVRDSPPPPGLSRMREPDVGGVSPRMSPTPCSAPVQPTQEQPKLLKDASTPARPDSPQPMAPLAPGDPESPLFEPAWGEDEQREQAALEAALDVLVDCARTAAAQACQHLQAADPNFTVMVEDQLRRVGLDNLKTGSDLKIVMCLATYCRTEQLQAALPINLACSWHLRENVIWVLADLNDEAPSQELLSWLSQNVYASLQTKQLCVFRPAQAWNGWHASVAKNTSHMAGLLAAGDVIGGSDRLEDVILVNCDADNLPSSMFYQYLLQRYDELSVPVTRDNHGLEWPKTLGVIQASIGNEHHRSHCLVRSCVFTLGRIPRGHAAHGGTER